MKNKKLASFIFFLSLFSFHMFPSKVYAQMTCTGSACNLMPLSPDQFNQMLIDLRYQYLDVVMEDMGKAAVISNMSGAPVGTVNLSGFSIGGIGAAGYVKEHKVPVAVTGVGTVTELPSAGFNVVPKAHVGMNLGKFFGLSYDPFKDDVDSKPSWYSLARFDVYLSGMRYKYNKETELNYNFLNGSPSLTDSYSILSDYKGVDVYYHIMEGKSFAGTMLGFLGLSAGLGYHDSIQKIDYYKADSKAVINLNAGNQIVWHASDLAKFHVNVRSNTAEIKSGVRFLYFFTLTGAYGTALNSGSANINYQRFGRIYLSSDYSAALGLTVPDAWLTMNIASEKKVPKKTNYFKVGLELNFAAVKVGFEGIQVGKDQGGSVGIRVVF